VRKENERVIKFHKRFGAIETGEDELNYYFALTPPAYESFKRENTTLLTAAGQGS
jgi:hypothetical protein